MIIFYVYYICHSVVSRLLPYTRSDFAHQTRSRYQYEYSCTPGYRADQNLPRWKSVFWRLVRAENREKYFQACALNFLARGLFMNVIYAGKWYFFGTMTWIALSRSIPFTVSALREWINW